MVARARHVAGGAVVNLFEFADRYPSHPGFRDTDTSKEAAAAIAPRQGTLQAKVLAFIRERGQHGAASFEIASGLGIKYKAIQPRTSELKADNFIEDSGLRRVDPDTQRRAIVWRARG